MLFWQVQKLFWQEQRIGTKFTTNKMWNPEPTTANFFHLPMINSIPTERSAEGASENMGSFFLPNWSPLDDPARPLPAEGRPWPSTFKQIQIQIQTCWLTTKYSTRNQRCKILQAPTNPPSLCKNALAQPADLLSFCIFPTRATALFFLFLSYEWTLYTHPIVKNHVYPKLLYICLYENLHSRKGCLHWTFASPDPKSDSCLKSGQIWCLRLHCICNVCL